MKIFVGVRRVFERSVASGNRGNNYPNTISQLGVLAEYYLQHSKRQSTDGINFQRPIEGNQCGQQKFQPKITRRIFGGITAQPHSWPWVGNILLEFVSSHRWLLIVYF